MLTLPADHRVKDFRTIGLWSPTFAKNYGAVVVAESIEPPMNAFLEGRLVGDKYGLGSGPIVILDRRTIKIYAFTFEGDRAPGEIQLIYSIILTQTRTSWSATARR